MHKSKEWDFITVEEVEEITKDQYLKLLEYKTPSHIKVQLTKGSDTLNASLINRYGKYNLI